jgi:putative methionine-R-sulfoxide reductase with GAF domain
MTKDPNRILRLVPLGAGGVAGTLLMLNRVLTPELTDSQARSDAVGVILAAVLVLTGLLWQQVQPRRPDSIILDGEQGFDLLPELPDSVKTELAWASHLLLTNTVTRSIVVYYQGRVILRRGVLATKAEVTPGVILDRVLSKQKAIYLVDTKVYPGRIEFDYLPANTQGIICQPLGTHGVMILGANAPRSYTKQDEAWIEGIADKLANSLELAFS